MATATPTQLRASDRCDLCAVGADQPAGKRRGLARAYVRIRLIYSQGPRKGEMGELDFCRHHFEAHEETLRSLAVEIHDERES